MSGAATVEAVIADAHRREWGKVLAATARVARDLDLAEECVQEAYAAAAHFRQAALRRSGHGQVAAVGTRDARSAPSSRPRYRLSTRC